MQDDERVKARPAPPKAGTPEQASAELLAKMAIMQQFDHERMARIESMLTFMLEKECTQLNRRPLPGEKLEGKSSRVLYQRTWYEEWRAAWDKKMVERQKAEEGNGESDPNDN